MHDHVVRAFVRIVHTEQARAPRLGLRSRGEAVSDACSFGALDHVALDADGLVHVIHGTEAGGDVLRGWKEAQHEPRFVAVAVNVLDVDGALRGALTRSGARVQRLCPVFDGNARALTVRDRFGAAVTHGFEDDGGSDAACESSHVLVMARVERRRSQVPFDGDEAGLIRRITNHPLGVATGQHHFVHGRLTWGQVAHHGGVHAVRGDAHAAVSPSCG